MAGRDVGISAILQIGAISVYANISATSPDFNRAMQPIIVATGGSNSLIGYRPSTGAKSGFVAAFEIPYIAGFTLLNAVLSGTPYPVTMSMGTAGGATVIGNLCRDLTVAGSEGGILECRVALDSITLPAPGTYVLTQPAGDIWKFTDAVSTKLTSGTVYTDFSSFSFHVQRVLANYKGNSPTGVAKYLKVVRTEAMLDSTYLKIGDLEGTAAIGNCPTLGDCNVLLTQACPIGANPATTLGFTVTNAFEDGYPKVVGGVEDFISEAASVKAYTGGFVIIGT